MKFHHMISLLQTTVKVQYLNGRGTQDKDYTYKVPLNA